MNETRKDNIAAGMRFYKQYQVYKGSGIELLREISSHWEIKRLTKPSKSDIPPENGI